jgi:hypothetical protein
VKTAFAGNPTYLRVKVPRLEEVGEATTICELGDDVQHVVCDPVVVVPVACARRKGSRWAVPASAHMIGWHGFTTGP